jgi:hypothetical protein
VAAAAAAGGGSGCGGQGAAASRVRDMLDALGSLLQDQGEYDRALPLLEDCLEKRKRILGDDHPHTLKSIQNLALWLKRYSSAEIFKSAMMLIDSFILPLGLLIAAKQRVMDRL